MFLTQKIGSILADVAFYADDLVVTAEALDSLFDVFKEDNTDQIVKEIGLVEKLVALQPSFRSKVGQICWFITSSKIESDYIAVVIGSLLKSFDIFHIVHIFRFHA